MHQMMRLCSKKTITCDVYLHPLKFEMLHIIPSPFFTYIFIVRISLMFVR